MVVRLEAWLVELEQRLMGVCSAYMRRSHMLVFNAEGVFAHFRIFVASMKHPRLQQLPTRMPFGVSKVNKSIASFWAARRSIT